LAWGLFALSWSDDTDARQTVLVNLPSDGCMVPGGAVILQPAW
jgi:hypothetical protein